MSKEKRRVGRPRLHEDSAMRHHIAFRDDIMERLIAATEKHSAVLGFNINRQQFMEVMLTHWENTREDK